tara:strand:+ start:347 stop:1102 length:756 start_codon:yes stop_codon:yes gene_type:complete
MKKFLVLMFVSAFLSSCSLLYRGILGVDTTPEWYNNEDLTKAISKRKLTNDIVLILDTASYRNDVVDDLYEVLDSLKLDTNAVDYKINVRKAIKLANDDLQSTQIRLFTSGGNEIFKLVNCYIDPPIPMNWNVAGCFDAFPPTIAEENLNVHNFDLAYILNNSTKLNGDSITLYNLPKSDYYMLVTWNSFMIKPSKKAIKVVKKYIKENLNQSITPIYINNHNAQMWGMMDSTQRSLIYAYEQELAKESDE